MEKHSKMQNIHVTNLKNFMVITSLSSLMLSGTSLTSFSMENSDPTKDEKKSKDLVTHVVEKESQDTLLSTTKDKKLSPWDLMNEARRLCQSSDSESQKLGLQKYLSIAEDQEAFDQLRVEAANTLFHSSDSELQNRGLQVLISIIQGKATLDATRAAVKTLMSNYTDRKIDLKIKEQAACIYLFLPIPYTDGISISHCAFRKYLIGNNELQIVCSLIEATILFD